MSRYIDADELLKRLPNDLPYKGSVRRVLMQAPTEDVVPLSDTLSEVQTRLAVHFGTYSPADTVKINEIFLIMNLIANEMEEGVY